MTGSIPGTAAHGVARPSTAFLLPFIIAALVHTACTASGGMLAFAAPLIAASATLYLTCVASAAMTLEEAGMAVAGALGVLGAAMFALPFLLNDHAVAMGAWVAASDLGLVAMFASEMLARSGAWGDRGRVVASAVMAQSGLIAAVFVVATPFAMLGFVVLLFFHSIALRKTLEERQYLPFVIVRRT